MIYDELIKEFGNNLIPIDNKPIRCCYGLYRKKKLVYIGSSANFLMRLGQHIRDGSKNFDSYCILVVPDGIKLENVESELIIKYRPVYNGNIPFNDHYMPDTYLASKYFFKSMSSFKDHCSRMNIRPCFDNYYLAEEFIQVVFSSDEFRDSALKELRDFI